MDEQTRDSQTYLRRHFDWLPGRQYFSRHFDGRLESRAVTVFFSRHFEGRAEGRHVGQCSRYFDGRLDSRVVTDCFPQFYGRGECKHVSRYFDGRVNSGTAGAVTFPLFFCIRAYALPWTFDLREVHSIASRM